MSDVRALDLFCGAGGSAVGAQLAGANVVAAVDAWPLAADTYALNFPEARVFKSLVDGVAARRVRELAGNIDLIVASPECTSHSVAKGNAPRSERSRETAFAVLRFARVLRPRWLVVENVAQMRHWSRYAEWKTALASLGYHVASEVLNAQYFGTPQSRRRLFVVGDREKAPLLPKGRRRTTQTVLSILGRGEPSAKPWQYSPLHAPNRAEATIERAERAMEALGRREPFLLVYYGTDGAGGFQSLDRPLRTVTTVDRFAYVRYRRGRHEMRMLQPSELAAAMGFPSTHKWADSNRRDRIKLVGNAVCPQVMRRVVRALTSGSG